MRYCILSLLLIINAAGFGQNKNAVIYAVPDSIKATGFYAEVKITETPKLKKNSGGISANSASMIMSHEKDRPLIQFRFFDKARPDIVLGKDVYAYGPGNAWNYNWKYDQGYPLLILTASDSATRKTIYSGYIYLPDEKKWKLIATRVYADTFSIKSISTGSRKSTAARYSNRWLLRSNNTWKGLDSQTIKPPSLRPMSNIDSLYQQQLEEDALRASLPKDSAVYKEGIFYQLIKEGTGRLVHVTDTVVVFYRGTLFSNNIMFDETKEKPATFPLGRLIKGWQIGLPNCRVGGKIRLYIPSGSAYGIRTFAATIPPNSTLVFDVEVVDTREKIIK